MMGRLNILRKDEDMTRNKKKLRRLERLAGAAKTGGRGTAARTLLVTGALLGGLMAAPAWGAAPAPVELKADDSVTISTKTVISTYTVNGGELIIQGGHNDARLSYTDADDDASHFIMQAGKATITGGNVDVGRVTVSGGEVSLTGSAAAWREAAYLGGYDGLIVSGGTVNMGANSELFIGRNNKDGAVMTLSGGTINMLGTAADHTAAHIWAGSPDVDASPSYDPTGPHYQPNQLLLSGAVLNVGDGGGTRYYGIVNSQDTAMSAGAVNVSNGVLRIQANPDSLLWADTSNIPAKVGEGVWNMTGGSLTVNNGSVQSLLKAFNVTGGTVNLTNGYLDNEFTTVAGDAVVSLIGAADTWNAAAYVAGYGGLTIGGDAVINMGANSELFTGKTTIAGVAQPFGVLRIKENAVINMNGTGFTEVMDGDIHNAAHIWAGADVANRLEINGGTINVLGDAVISSLDTSMSGGSIVVGPQGNLMLQGKPGAKGDRILDSTPAGTWTMFGGLFDATDGYVHSTLNSFNVAGGVFQTGILNVTTDHPYENDAVGEDAVFDSFNGFIVSDRGVVKVNDLIVDGKTLTVAGGNLSVANTLANTAGDIDVTGGVLNLNGGKVLTADGKGLASGVNLIDVSGAGVVSLGVNDLTLTLAELTATKNALVGSSGRWSVTGFTVSDIEDAKTEAETAAGGKVDTLTPGDTLIVGDANAQHYAVAADMTSGTEASLGGDSASGQIALTNSGDLILGDAVSITTSAIGNKQTTVIGGAEGTPLVVGAGDAKTHFVVADGGTLALGSAAVAGGGTLNGGITADSGAASATLMANNGTFAVESVDLSAAGSSSLNLNQAAVLNVAGGVTADMVSLTGASLAADAASVTGLTLEQGSSANLAELLADGGINLSQGSSLAADQVDTASLSLESGSAVTARNLTLQNGDVGADSTVQTGALVMAGGSLLLVGNEDGKGVVIADTAQLNGAAVFLDPAWRNGASITEASQMLVGGSLVDGLYTVGRNAHVTFGSTDQSWLAGVASRAGVAWGENATTAAVGVYSPQTLIGMNGGLTVNGALENLGNINMKDHAVSGSAYFGGQSLLVVNSGNLDGQAAITSTTHGTAMVADTAQLLLTDAVAGQTYVILSGFDASDSSIDAGGWSGGNLFQPSSYMLSLNLHDDLAVDGSVSVSADRNNAIDVLPGISSGMAGLVDAVYAQGLNGVNTSNAGVRFVSRATDSGFMPASESARALESAAQAALAGGAPSVAFDAVTAATGAVGERTSISVPSFSRQAGISAGDNGHSFGVWATPLFRSTEIDGQKAGAFKYGVDSDLWGGAIGADVTNGNFRLGVALNVGGGDAKSSGDLYKTKNDFDFWGATAYAGYRLDNLGVGSLGLSADLGYSAVSSDIKQNLDLNLGMGGQLQSKVDADVYSVGMKAEYVIPTAFMDVTPSVGVRYNAYRQGRYNVDGAYGTVFNMDKSEMDTWTFPIGVKFSRDFNTTGWSVRPELNLAFIPAAGDTELDSKARIPGLGIAPAALTGHVFDDWTGEAGVGLTVAKENVSFGLNYDFQGSENRKSHSVFGTLRIAF